MSEPILIVEEAERNEFLAKCGKQFGSGYLIAATGVLNTSNILERRGVVNMWPARYWAIFTLPTAHDEILVKLAARRLENIYWTFGLAVTALIVSVLVAIFK